MKKIFLVTFIAGLALVSCGPSAKQIEETRIADSIRVADSLAMEQANQQMIADSIAKADAEKHIADSIANKKAKK